MAQDNEPLHAHEPLLLPALIEAHRGNAAGDGTVTRIIRGLIESPVTDAERAGERLPVFGWQVASRDGKPSWTPTWSWPSPHASSCSRASTGSAADPAHVVISPAKRGLVARKSVSESWSMERSCPVRNPRPSGE